MMLQFVLMSLPIFLMLVYFITMAWLFSESPCSKSMENWVFANAVDEAEMETMKEQQVQKCSKTTWPMFDFLMVFVFINLLWFILAIYLSYFVKKRHDLVERYLESGERGLGDVFFNEGRTAWPKMLHFGSVTYLHPAHRKLPVYIRREVRLFELYSRENVAILRLPNMPFSGQVKIDLEVDREISKRNQPLLRAMAVFAWIWVLFTWAGIAYLLYVMNTMDEDLNWQRELDIQRINIAVAVVVLLLIPLLALVGNAAAWASHVRWMTADHKIVEEGEPEGSTGTCFDKFTRWIDKTTMAFCGGGARTPKHGRRGASEGSMDGSGSSLDHSPTSYDMMNESGTRFSREHSEYDHDDDDDENPTRQNSVASVRVAPTYTADEPPVPAKKALLA